MNEFDDLGRRLRDAAGLAPDMAFARSEFTRRIGRARRRRAAAVSSAAAVMLLSFGAVYSLGVRNGSTPGQSAASIGDQQSSTSASNSADSTNTVASTIAATKTPASTTQRTESSTTVPSSTVVSTTLPGTQTPAPGNTGAKVNPSSSGPSSSHAPTTSSTTPPPAVTSVTKTFTSLGGTITVRAASGVLTLEATQPALGYEVESIDPSTTEITVEFRSDSGTSRIQVRFDDGEMVAKVSEDNDHDNDGTNPDNRENGSGNSGGESQNQGSSDD